MIAITQNEIMDKLADLIRLSPEIRFGQLLANLEFLIEDQTEQTLREIEDVRLLDIMETHRLDLMNRLQPDV